MLLPWVIWFQSSSEGVEVLQLVSFSSSSHPQLYLSLWGDGVMGMQRAAWKARARAGRPPPLQVSQHPKSRCEAVVPLAYFSPCR